MSYGRTCYPEDFPFDDKEAQYQYGLKDAYRAWDRMVERATIGSIVHANPPYRREPIGNPISNMIRHLAYCDHNEYNSEEYFKGFLKGAEEKLREAIINDSSKK